MHTVNRVLRATAVASMVAAGSLTGSSPSNAAAEKRNCHSTGAKVIKRRGPVVVYHRDIEGVGDVYVACSTRYGRRVRLASDASALVDEDFSLERLRIAGGVVTMTYTIQYDTGNDRYTVRANLRTGKVQQTTVDISGAGEGG